MAGRNQIDGIALILSVLLLLQPASGAAMEGGPTDEGRKALHLLESMVEERLEGWWLNEGAELRDVGASLWMPELAGSCSVEEDGQGRGYFSYITTVHLHCSLEAMEKSIRLSANGVGPSRETAIRDAALKLAMRVSSRLQDEIWRRAAARAMGRLRGHLDSLRGSTEKMEEGESILMDAPTVAENIGGAR